MDKLVGIIGGSGFDDGLLPGGKWRQFRSGFTDNNTHEGGTGIVDYKIDVGQGIVYFLRHGRDGDVQPSAVENGAMMLAAKYENIGLLIGITACGTRREDYQVGSVMIPSQSNNHSGRSGNLYTRGFRIHVKPFFTGALRDILLEDGEKYFENFIPGGNVLTIPGDSFGWEAEGNEREQFGDAFGMTLGPEVLASFHVGIDYGSVTIIVDKDRNAKHSTTGSEMAKIKPSLEAYFKDKMPLFNAYANRGQLLEQLYGSLGSCNPEKITNDHLRKVAVELWGIPEYRASH